MSPALVSLFALLLAIVLSCSTRLNIGLVAIPLAWLTGLYGGASAGEVMAGFPSTLFLTLTGVTLLFTQAESNGTLTLVAQGILRFARGSPGWVAILFFAMPAALSSSGAGAIAATALTIPIAMGIAHRADISPFLMAVLVGLGANAGNLVPFSPVGVVTAGILARSGLGGQEWTIYRNILFAHCAVASAVFVFFGGMKLFRQPHLEAGNTDANWSGTHYLTLLAIASVLLAVVLVGVPIGLASFAAATVLTVFRAADEARVLSQMPWGVIMMVCGVTLLIALLERTGGLDLFSTLIARFSTAQTLKPIVAFVTAAVSIYSSTSGVVLPAFLPAVPKLVALTGSTDPIGVVSAIVLGSHLVDISPLSTIGALAIAAAPEGVDRQRLFNRLLAFSLAMCPAGALASILFFRD